LVAALESAARSRGAKRIELDSAFHRNDAHTWYQHRGFSDRGVVFSKVITTP
jgi:hypothetical protein